jgi:hypothetical protein
MNVIHLPAAQIKALRVIALSVKAAIWGEKAGN